VAQPIAENDRVATAVVGVANVLTSLKMVPRQKPGQARGDERNRNPRETQIAMSSRAGKQAAATTAAVRGPTASRGGQPLRKMAQKRHRKSLVPLSTPCR